MKIEDLQIKLKEAGIQEDKYHLHGLYGSMDDNDKIALTIRREKTKIEFEVYYKEKGEKRSLKIFESEDEACQYVYTRLKENKEIEDKWSK